MKHRIVALALTLTAVFCSAAAMTMAEDLSTAHDNRVAGNLQEPFAAFIERIRTEAEQRGIAPDLLNQVLPGDLTPNPDILERFNRQPELTLEFAGYYDRLVTDNRVEGGAEQLREHAALLDRISAEYGVDKAVLVALWSIESNFGRSQGRDSIVRSLATLGCCAPRRRDFWSGELLAALEILHQGHITPGEMTGSWAGAMGQCQFMPTSFLNYAADGNGDGKKDIWNTPADVLASAANYLKRHGWETGAEWQQRVTLTENLPGDMEFYKGLSQHEAGMKPVSYWEDLGVEPKSGSYVGEEAYLFIPRGPSGKAWLVYNNFDVVKRWNISSYFAFTVLSLADKIRAEAAS